MFFHVVFIGYEQLFSIRRQVQNKQSASYQLFLFLVLFPPVEYLDEHRIKCWPLLGCTQHPDIAYMGKHILLDGTLGSRRLFRHIADRSI